MATFFGEVLPVTNRAYDDAEDEEESTESCNNPFSVNWMQEEKKLQAKTLIVTCSIQATAYVDALLRADVHPTLTLTSTEAGSEEAAGDWLYARRRRPPVSLLPLTADTWVCRCPPHVPPQEEHWLAETVLAQFAQPPAVFVLSSAPMSEYFSSSDICGEPPTILIRCLTTKHCELPGALTVLEAPNVVKGAAASVLSRCEFAGQRAVLVHLYTAALEPDSETTAAYHAAVSSLSPSLHALRPRPARPAAGSVSASVYM